MEKWGFIFGSVFCPYPGAFYKPSIVTMPLEVRRIEIFQIVKLFLVSSLIMEQDYRNRK